MPVDGGGGHRKVLVSWMASSRQQLRLVLEPVLIPQLAPLRHWPNCRLGTETLVHLQPGELEVI